MIKKNFLLYGTFFGLIGLIIFLYYPATQNQNNNIQETQSSEMTNIMSQLDEDELRVMDRVFADLSLRLGQINESAVEVIEFQKVDFSDGSLGCPEPEMGYAQVITPGYKILIKYENKEYDYRLSERDTIKICN